MKYTEALKEFKELPRVEFMNQHGEKFVLFKGPTGTVIFFGDETDWELQRLFDKGFDMWSNEELHLLGTALITLSKGNRS